MNNVPFRGELHLSVSCSTSICKFMNSDNLPTKLHKKKNLSQRQRKAKQAKISALRLEFVHPRTSETSEIGTAPPVSVPSVSIFPALASGVASFNPGSRTQVLSKLVTSLTTIADRDETILRLRKRLAATDEILRSNRTQINSWKHRAACFQRRVRELLLIVPPQQPTKANASPVASPEPLYRPNLSGRTTSSDLRPSANQLSRCQPLQLPKPRSHS